MKLSKIKKLIKETHNKSQRAKNIDKLVKIGYSQSDAEDLVDEYENGGVKLPNRVKQILSSNIKEEVSKTKIKAEYIGTDSWDRDIYKTPDGKKYVDVEGTLHTRTKQGEPDSPVYNVEKIERVKEDAMADEVAKKKEIEANKARITALTKKNQELTKPGATVTEAEDEDVVDDYEQQSKKDAEEFTSIDDMEPKITVNAKDKIKFKKLDFLYKEKIGIDKQIKSLVNDYKNKKGTSAEQEIVSALKDMNTKKKETEKLIYQLENELI